MFTDRLYNDTPAPLYNAVLSSAFSAEDTVEPVTLAEAKAWCRIDVNDDDAIMIELIKASRQMCEDYANKSFINRTVSAVIVAPNGYIKLPYGPVKLITDVRNEDNIVVEYSENKAGVKVQAEKAFVTYTAGFTTLPVKFKMAVLNQILFMYENRGDMQTISPAAKNSLKNVREI